jgi:hypothetical protein
MASDFSTYPFDIQRAATGHVSLVEIPSRRVIAIDGYGPPTSGDFRLAYQTLMSVAEGLRPLTKATHGNQPFVGSRILEVHWRPVDAEADLVHDFGERDRWVWQQFIPAPDSVEQADVVAVIARVAHEAGRATPLVRVETRPWWRAAQLLHLGTWAGQPVTLRKLLDQVGDLGLHAGREVASIRVADEDRVPVDRAASIVRVPIVA